MATATLLLPVLAILFGPRAWFVFHDPFLLNLHETIYEFQPITYILKLASGMVLVQFFNILPFLAIPAIALLCWKSVPRPEKAWLTLALLQALFFMVLLCRYMRWGIVLPGPLLVLLTVLVALVDTWRVSRHWPGIAKTLCIALAGVLLWVVPLSVLEQLQLLKEKDLSTMSREEAVSVVIREVGRDIYRSNKTATPVVLASPNASVRLLQQAGGHIIGSLYWWNVDGLKAAAEMYAAQDDATAEQLFRKHGVTHWAIISEDNYIEGYLNLYKATHPEATLEKTFAYRMGTGQKPPPWLRMMPVLVPDWTNSLNLQIVVFEVLPRPE